MWKYVIQDLVSTAQYIPYGILIGGLICFVLHIVSRMRADEKKEKLSAVKMIFWMYVAVMMMITFLSRERGSSGGMDLRIGSSLGINDRNDAYAVENILLFLPYGFLLGMLWKNRRCFLMCTGVGFLTSFGIECLQYISGRGVFQTDDLITNTIGAMAGYLLYCLLTGECNRKKK